MSQPLMKQAEGQGPDDTLRRHLAWSGTPPTAARARAEADALLSALHHTFQVPVAPRTADDVRLVVSELVTNAARHAPGPGRLEIQTADRGRTVRITVWDTSPAMPQPRPVNPHRAGATDSGSSSPSASGSPPSAPAKANRSQPNCPSTNADPYQPQPVPRGRGTRPRLGVGVRSHGGAL
ncbi:ATP-binding protein [Streptomyces plicatus]|uniref:ATP-binding protein n=1 Tax=Streptomyces plicatus TaxID=1922 RepID=A0ABW1Y4H7_STRPL